MAGAGMSQSKSADRRSDAVVTESATAKQKRKDAKNTLPAMNTYLGIPNPNSTQQRDQITLLTNAALADISGTLGT